MNLRKSVSKGLVEIGFVREDRRHLRRVAEGVSIWVDTGPLGKRSDIAPFVGVRHDLVEELFSRFLGLNPDPLVGTVGANVGYVLGVGYLAWHPPSSREEVLNSIQESFSILERFFDFEQLPGAWAIQGAKAPGWRFRMIIVFALLGRIAEMEECIEDGRAKSCRFEDKEAEQFRAFESRLREYLSGEGERL